MIKNGTIYAGMSTRGNCAIALVVTFKASPWMKPEQIVPIDTATTKSTIPRIFHITYRRLAAKDGWRIRREDHPRRGDADRHVPESRRESEQSRQKHHARRATENQGRPTATPESPTRTAGRRSGRTPGMRPTRSRPQKTPPKESRRRGKSAAAANPPSQQMPLESQGKITRPSHSANATKTTDSHARMVRH